MKRLLQLLFGIKGLTDKVDYTNLKFKPGQKVNVWYYNVYYGWRNVFQPPQNGIIVSIGDGLHLKNRCDKDFNFKGICSDEDRKIYWKVKFNCGTFDIPQGFIKDLKEHIEKESAWHELPHVKQWKEEGYQEDSRIKLIAQLNESQSFLNDH